MSQSHLGTLGVWFKWFASEALFMRWERLYIAPYVNKTTKPWTPVLGQCSSDTTAVGLSYHNIQDHPLISAKTKKNSAMHVGFFWHIWVTHQHGAMTQESPSKAVAVSSCPALVGWLREEITSLYIYLKLTLPHNLRRTTLSSPFAQCVVHGSTYVWQHYVCASL